MADKFIFILFARKPQKVIEFAAENLLTSSNYTVFDSENFKVFNTDVDVIINCIGFGTPDKVKTAGGEIFRITEKYDNEVIEYLIHNPETIYINFSSGAVYGTNHIKPIDVDAEFRINLNQILPGDAYRISKLNSEAKHRAFPELSIVDIRLFSFFSEYIELDSNYLICDLIRSVRLGKPFITSKSDIVRDYIHPADLSRFVEKCIEKKLINTALDLYSGGPVKKSEIIHYMENKYNLNVQYGKEEIHLSPTGVKNIYVSGYKKAESEIGYLPEYNSLEAISYGLQKILG